MLRWSLTTVSPIDSTGFFPACAVSGCKRWPRNALQQGTADWRCRAVPLPGRSKTEGEFRSPSPESPRAVGQLHCSTWLRGVPAGELAGPHCRFSSRHNPPLTGPWAGGAVAFSRTASLVLLLIPSTAWQGETGSSVDRSPSQLTAGPGAKDRATGLSLHLAKRLKKTPGLAAYSFRRLWLFNGPLANKNG